MSRTRETGSIYLGIAGGLFAVSALLVGGYFVLGGKASAGTTAPAPGSASAAEPRGDTGDLASLVATTLEDGVKVVIASQEVAMRWSDLGVVVDEAELDHAVGRVRSDEPIAALRGAGALPVRVDREK